MSNPDPRREAPTPRDYEEATFSELVPFRSTQINVLKSPLLWVIGGTGVMILVLYNSFGEFFSTGGDLKTFLFFGLVTIGYILLTILALIYVYARTDRPFWHFIVPAVFVYAALMTPLGAPYFTIFRGWLDPQWVNGNSFMSHFIYMFFAAGLMEELMKNTTTLLGAVLFVKYASLRQNNAGVFDILAIRGPLDGLLMGVVGGAMFIFVETGFQYFPKQFAQQATAENLLSGLMLLLPRTISGMVGHMGWAGILGYFIGLWVLRPSTWKYMLYAWIVVSGLHAMWNSQSFVPLFGIASVGATTVLLVACLLKARQISTTVGATRNDYGSIVIMPGDRPTSQLLPLTSAPTSAVVGNQAGPQPGAFLVMGDARVRAFAGEAVDFGPLADQGQQPSDLSAEVTRHPTRADVIGLKNTGARKWTAILRDGKRMELETGRNIRLAAGVQIDFGAGPIATVEVV
ncbi:MAG: PrsW family glutamic-type intramembrane protease [Sulfitobacter sp.]